MEASNLSNRLTTIQVIHWSVALAITLFAIVVLFLNGSKPVVEPGKAIDYLLYVPILSLVGAIPVSGLIYNQLLKKKVNGLSEKIKLYQTGTIVRDVFYEIPGILTCIIAFVLNNNFILMLIPVILLLFYANRPVIKKMKSDLSLTLEEERQLGGPLNH